MDDWKTPFTENTGLMEYPRPHMRREPWKSLNGWWDFAVQEDMPAQWKEKILVPYSMESHLSGIGRQLQPQETSWQRTFTDWPEEGTFLIHFQAADQKCTVYVDGQEVLRHEGGYWPFTIEVQGGSHEIIAACQDVSDGGDEAWGKQKRKRGGIWYTGQSGLWQSVWMEKVPEGYIEDIQIETDLKGIDLEVAGAGPFEAVVSLKGETICRKVFENQARLEWDHPQHWSPENPVLYDLEIKSPTDKVSSYFGLRTVEARDGIPYLNGRPVFFNGILDQGYWSDGLYTPVSDEAMVFDIAQLKAMGFNMIRKHIKMEPWRWYWHCDRLGMLVWQDFVSGGGPYSAWNIQVAPFIGMHRKDANYTVGGRVSKAGRDNFRRDMKRTIDTLKHFPSIVVWVPFNEGWGQFDAAAIAQEVKRLDPSRLVDHASGWHDQGAGDFSSWHVYYKSFKPDLKDGRILALTEFGGYSLTSPWMFSDKLFGYKVFQSLDAWEAAMEKLYERDVLPWIAKGLRAVVYTQVSDVEDEINGLFAFNRRSKGTESCMKKLNARVWEAVKKHDGTCYDEPDEVME